MSGIPLFAPLEPTSAGSAGIAPAVNITLTTPKGTKAVVSKAKGKKKRSKKSKGARENDLVKVSKTETYDKIGVSSIRVFKTPDGKRKVSVRAKGKGNSFTATARPART